MSVSRRNLLLGAVTAIPAGALLLGRCKSAGPLEAPATARGNGRTVARIVAAAATMEGAGVKVHRALGGRALSVLDPFLLLDEFKSDDPSDYVAGFPDHPHRGFETVTYMLEGAMEHRDSVGNHGRLGPGSAQWMTAGHGIVHSEMPKQERGLMWGYQLWVNLPKRDKMVRPRYQDIAPTRIPEVSGERVKARVVAGTALGATGPVAGIDVDPVFVDFAMDKGARLSLPLPEGHSAFAFVADGAVRIGPENREIRAGELAVLGSDSSDFVASCDAERGRVLVIAGRPIGEPVARRGPFVMNTEDELDRAFEEYRKGTLTEDG